MRHDGSSGDINPAGLLGRLLSTIGAAAVSLSSNDQSRLLGLATASRRANLLSVHKCISSLSRSGHTDVEIVVGLIELIDRYADDYPVNGLTPGHIHRFSTRKASRDKDRITYC